MTVMVTAFYIDNKPHFRISYYATASTEKSVLIIGGLTPEPTSIIAEYKNESWKNIGNLAQARKNHVAISSGPVTMIVGGYPHDHGNTITELWEFDSLETQIIDLTLSRSYENPGVFLVDVGYCSKN